MFHRCFEKFTRNISSHRGRKKKKNFNRGGEETRVVNSVGRVDRELRSFRFLPRRWRETSLRPSANETRPPPTFRLILTRIKSCRRESAVIYRAWNAVKKEEKAIWFRVKIPSREKFENNIRIIRVLELSNFIELERRSDSKGRLVSPPFWKRFFLEKNWIRSRTERIVDSVIRIVKLADLYRSPRRVSKEWRERKKEKKERIKILTFPFKRHSRTGS